MGFASMLDGTFGYERSGTTAQKIDNAREDFTQELCDRLKRVTVENENGINLIERTITASKVSRRRQEEWITTNY